VETEAIAYASGGKRRGLGGQKFPSGVHGRSPGKGLGDKVPHELEKICAKLGQV